MVGVIRKLCELYADTNDIIEKIISSNLKLITAVIIKS